MAEATIKFEREEREGIVPVGTYLNSAAERLGVRFESRCMPGEKTHFCRVTIGKGGENLSAMTAAETESFENEPGTLGERLACQTKIVEPGEITIMTKEKEASDGSQDEKKEREYAKEFADLPLEKKFAELVHLEAITLGETFSFIFNSPYLAFDKVIDVMAGYGLRKEETSKKAARPAEHSTAAEDQAETNAEKLADEEADGNGDAAGQAGKAG